MRRITAAALAILAVFVTTAAARNTDESCFASKINQERTSRGIPALKANATLDMIARAHSNEMAQRGTVYHNDNLREELPAFTYAGENVGEGPDCETLHAAFMSSPGHKANILDRDYTDLGVGVTRSDDILFVTEDFLRPKVAARPPAKRPPSPQPKRSPVRCSP